MNVWCTCMCVWECEFVCVWEKECVCAGSKCLCGAHSILVFGLGVVTTILTPFVWKERKSGIVTCGISKQAIVNIVRTEWRPLRLRAAFEDIMPNSVVSMAVYLCQRTCTYRSLTFFRGCTRELPLVVDHFLICQFHVFHSKHLLSSLNSSLWGRSQP